MEVEKEWIIKGGHFSPLSLTHQADGFAQIEHPIRDDLEKTNSIVRAALKAALEPHGIEVLNHT